MASDLARDTAVTRLKAAPGWYTAELGNQWDFRTPSGGVLMSVALRAMQAELANAEMRLISAHTHFCSPVPVGPIQVRVEVLRCGASAAQVRGQLSSCAMPGPGLEVSATFGIDRDGIELMDAEFPAVGLPAECRSFEDMAAFSSRERPRFFENLESRLAAGNVWWEEGWAPGPARIARWFRYKVPQAMSNGRLDPLALPPIADTMPPALIQKLGPGHKPFFAPSLDLTVHFLEETRSQWLLTNVHARRARGGYATADVEIWDEDRRLIAMATQMMILRNVNP